MVQAGATLPVNPRLRAASIHSCSLFGLEPGPSDIGLTRCRFPGVDPAAFLHSDLLLWAGFTVR